MHRHGLKTVGDLLGRRPGVATFLADIYEAFYMLDRDGMSGRVLLSSMREMLAEIGIERPAERRKVLAIWRAMDSAQHEIDKRLSSTEKNGNPSS